MENPSGIDIDGNEPRRDIFRITHSAKPRLGVKHELQSMIADNTPPDDELVYPKDI